MKKLLVTVSLLMLAIPVFAYADTCEYEITLPPNYETGGLNYPVVYVLPEDGFASDSSSLTVLLEDKVEAIIVRPAFEKDADAAAELSALTAEIDSKYRTLSDREHRALIGTGTGGYLAYALGLSSDSFGVIAGIRGDFVSEANPWKDVYGDVYTLIKDMHAANPDVFNNFYTYMDAPVDDTFTNMQGSTNDMGALFIDFGTGSAFHEFTVRPGSFGEDFLAESANRVTERLNERWYPTEETEAPAAISGPQPPVIDGEYQAIDLSGEWNFFYAGAKDGFDAAALTAEEIQTWPLAPVAMGNWTKGYGNISDENVNAQYGPDYFDYFIVGAGYYAKTFTVPAEFDAQEIILSIGYVDDRCEVFFNGKRVGATGMDENGMPTGETSWALYSHFAIDPAQVVVGGENTVVVRVWNDTPMGAGGWYNGPVGLYSKAAFDEINPEKINERFYEETFTSKFAASAIGQSEPVENKYLIYLPEGYKDSGRRYPTVYLLHQFNSDHTSYKTDKVDELLDAGIAEGLFDEMIVVIPNSDSESWWAGDWEKMITEELIPHIDAQYRTIRDARYRLTAGCSMGGQGSMAVALRNPDFFSGAISFFGAFSYGNASSPNAIADAESAEYLNNFALYFICGNQDSYGFGAPAIELNQQLEKKGVEHRFFIENGGHDSAFYVPFFADAFSYINARMHQADGALYSLLSGTLNAEGNTITGTFTAAEGIEAYFNTIPASSYTLNQSPPLHVPLSIEILKDGESVHTASSEDSSITTEDLELILTCDLNGLLEPGEYTAVFNVHLFESTTELATMTFTVD